MAKTEPEIVSAIAAQVSDAAPDQWAEITLTVQASVLVYQFGITARSTDRRLIAIDPPSGLQDDVSALRGVMYEQGRGTWFSARISLCRGENPVASFNFDADPAWWPHVPPTVFSRDLEVFPRSPEHVPSWLREVLDEAAEFERQNAAGG